MKLLISDSNIFIDMEVGGLIEAMFGLPEKFGVPNILYAEELSEHHPQLPAYGLLIMTLDESTVEESQRLRQVYRRASQNDLFALALAKQERCPLVTGDGKLRDAADQEGVEIKGTLWLVERIVEESIISLETASDAYERMRRDGRRLPWGDVDRQLERLREKKKA
jgi:hypothetical protein